MKIAFVTTEYITEVNFYGGLANYLYKLGQILIRDGHNVTIYVLSHKSETLTHDGITVIRVNSFIPTWFASVSGQGFSALLECIIGAFLMARKVRGDQNLLNYDIIQFSSYKALPYFANRIKNSCLRISSTEKLLNQHRQTKPGFFTSVLENFEFKAILKFKHVFAPSRLVAQNVESISGKKIDVIPSPAEGMVMKVDKGRLIDAPYLLSFGKLNSVKGVDILADVMPEIMNYNRWVHFVFVGEDEKFNNQKMSEHLVKNLDENMRQRVHFFPSMRRDDLISTIFHSEMVLIPSRVDNLPNSCLESMSLGKIVIGSDHCSIEEIIEHGVNGYLHQWGNSQDIVTLIMDVLNLDQEYLSKISENAVARSEEFSKENTIPLLYQFYRGVNGKMEYRKSGIME